MLAVAKRWSVEPCWLVSSWKVICTWAQGPSSQNGGDIGAGLRGGNVEGWYLLVQAAWDVLLQPVLSVVFLLADTRMASGCRGQRGGVDVLGRALLPAEEDACSRSAGSCLHIFPCFPGWDGGRRPGFG